MNTEVCFLFQNQISQDAPARGTGFQIRICESLLEQDLDDLLSKQELSTFWILYYVRNGFRSRRSFLHRYALEISKNWEDALLTDGCQLGIGRRFDRLCGGIVAVLRSVSGF